MSNGLRRYFQLGPFLGWVASQQLACASAVRRSADRRDVRGRIGRTDVTSDG